MLGSGVRLRLRAGNVMENHKEKHLAAATELRRTAKGQAHAKTAEVHPPPISPRVATQRFSHELEVHQIELEMQNAELLHARDELEVSRKKYAELYDFAPVGYFTFDAAGVIRAVNLAGADLLGVERDLLTNPPLPDIFPMREGERFCQSPRPGAATKGHAEMRNQPHE